jgi:hypothetical protein
LPFCSAFHSSSIRSGNSRLGKWIPKHADLPLFFNLVLQDRVVVN